MTASKDDPSRYARRPPNAFLIFCKKNRPVVRKYHPNVENRTITRMLGEWWSHLDPEHKAYYIQLAKKNKDEFLRAHPDFKWYKLPALPLRHLGTRPSNKKLKKEPHLIDSSAISHGKLADENQLGALSSLLSPPKPPNKRYLELNYCKGEEKPSESSLSDSKHLLSLDYVPLCEVKKEPLEQNEEEENELIKKTELKKEEEEDDQSKSSIKTEIDSDSGMSSMSSSTSFKRSKIRNSASDRNSTSCDEPESYEIDLSDKNFLGSNLPKNLNGSRIMSENDISNDVNKGSIGEVKPSIIPNPRILPLVSSSTLETSQQMIIDCVVDNSFKNDGLSISNYNCSTLIDSRYCQKIEDRYSEKNCLLNDGRCEWKEGLLSECIVDSIKKTTTDMNGFLATNSTTEGFGEKYLKNNNEETVTSLPRGNNNETCNHLEHLSSLKYSTVNNYDKNIDAQKKLNRVRKGTRNKKFMGSNQMNVDELKPEIWKDELVLRKSERLRRAKSEYIDSDIPEFPKEENVFENDLDCSVKDENSDEDCEDIKCEDKLDIKHFINFDFEKEIEELPELNYEEFQLKKKEKRNRKSVMFFSDHDYIRSTLEPRKRRASIINSHDETNKNNINCTATSNDGPAETRYMYKKRFAYNRHLSGKDGRGFPKATASIGELTVDTPSSRGRYQADTTRNLSGSRKRKVPKRKIIHLEPGSSYRDTSVIEEAALALIAFSDAAYREMNCLMNVTQP